MTRVPCIFVYKARTSMPKHQHSFYIIYILFQKMEQTPDTSHFLRIKETCANPLQIRAFCSFCSSASHKEVFHHPPFFLLEEIYSIGDHSTSYTALLSNTNKVLGQQKHSQATAPPSPPLLQQAWSFSLLSTYLKSWDLPQAFASSSLPSHFSGSYQCH